MTDHTRQGNEMHKIMEAWMETGKRFWQDMGAQQGQQDRSAGTSPFNFARACDDTDDQKHRTYRAWETSVSNFTSFFKLMSAPENRDELLKSATTFTEAMVQATGESLEHISEFQSQLIMSAAKINEHTKAFNLDDLNHEAFESFRELYRAELQKYFQMPKIGLPREFCEQLSQMADRSNIFSSHLAELLYLFAVPIERANHTMQEKTKRMLDRGEFIEDYKQAYNEWIKILELHYAELLKSKEYTHVLNNTINSLAEYKNIKHEVMRFFLKDMQVPTNKEMDEVYKDLYQMKKTIKELKANISALHEKISISVE